ncbi:hypothetical protein ES705_40599 [subsurface metagenome]
MVIFGAHDSDNLVLSEPTRHLLDIFRRIVLIVLYNHDLVALDQRHGRFEIEN